MEARGYQRWTAKADLEKGNSGECMPTIENLGKCPRLQNVADVDEISSVHGNNPGAQRLCSAYMSH